MRLLSRIKVLMPAPLIALAACEAAPTAPVDVSQSVGYSHTFKANLHLVERTSWADGNLIIDLHAVDKVTGAEVDLFRVPLRLELSYAGLQVTEGDLRDLMVVWLQDDSPDGRLVPVRTTVNRSTQYVTGWLTHFSQYAMGMN
jgi:hypothetical protein